MLAISWWPLTSNAQAFINLGFESAVIKPIPDPSHVEWDAAMPGWSGYYGDLYTGVHQRTSLLYNTLNIGSPGIALLGPESGYHIEGNYCLALQTGGADYATDVYITQTGVIPNNANSLQFIGSTARNGFAVSLNGQTINMAVMKAFGSSYYLYGADVSGLAGQTVELRITDITAFASPSLFIIDSFNFSPEAVPEPGTIALLCLGSIGLFLAARRRAS